MRLYRSALAALALSFVALSAWASPVEVGHTIPNAQKVGEARYHLFAIPIFNAELWAEQGAFSWQRPFALTLTYERSASERTLLNRTISEMSQRGAGSVRSLAPLRSALDHCFTNVSRGDRITGVSTGADTARFYYNGVERCAIEWPSFRRTFFGIWLDGRDGQAATLSARLRGDG